MIEYLRQHLMIDFQGDLTVGKVRELLAGDDSRRDEVSRVADIHSRCAGGKGRPARLDSK